MLDTTVPAGSKIRLQKDAANGTHVRDRLHQPRAGRRRSPTRTRPRYTVPAGFTQQDVQNALDKVRMDTTGNLIGVYLPAGDYADGAASSRSTARRSRSSAPARGTPGSTTPTDQENTDAGFRAESVGQRLDRSRSFAFFGNYTTRDRRPGQGRATSPNVVEHDHRQRLGRAHGLRCTGARTPTASTITNSRIRDTFADGINMTNGSTDNLVTNNEARSTGDDSFALFSATDAGGGRQARTTSSRT